MSDREKKIAIGTIVTAVAVILLALITFSIVKCYKSAAEQKQTEKFVELWTSDDEEKATAYWNESSTAALLLGRPKEGEKALVFAKSDTPIVATTNNAEVTAKTIDMGENLYLIEITTSNQSLKSFYLILETPCCHIEAGQKIDFYTEKN